MNCHFNPDPARRDHPTGLAYLLGFLILCIGPFTAPAALGNDKVYPKNGVPASGKITSLSPNKVAITVRSKSQEYPLSDVLKVTFDGEPLELERARDSFIEGQFDQALLEVKKVNPGSIESPVVRQEVEFYRWYCEGKLGLTQGGDTQGAINGLRAIVTSNRNTHHLYDVADMLGQLHLATNKPTEAAQYFGPMVRAPSPEIKASGLYQLARVDLAQDKANDAKERYSQIIGAPNSSPEMAQLKNLARVGMAVCDSLAGNQDQAIKELNKLVEANDSTDHELFARIFNAKGACYQAKQQPTQALLSYLKTDLLFFDASEAHAEALYQLKSLWTQYGNPSKAADAGKRLVSQYASSVWANRP